MKRFATMLLVIVPVLILALALPLAAQEATSVPVNPPTATPMPTPAPGSIVMVIGPVEFINNNIVVNGYIIAPAGAFNPSILTPGDFVIITGLLLPDGMTIQASEFEFFEEPDGTPTPTPTMTPIVITATPTFTPDPLTPTMTPLPVVVTVTPTYWPTPEDDDDACDRPNHPVALQLAQSFGVSYDEIIGWHCRGFGFGEIARAYLLAEQTVESPDMYFALKESGMGWGQIVRDAGISGSEHSSLAPGQVKHRDDDGHPGNGNGNNGRGNNGNGNGNGNGNNGNNGNGRGNGNGNGNGNNGNGNGNGRGNGNG
jgi:hypothetical protein